MNEVCEVCIPPKKRNVIYVKENISHTIYKRFFIAIIVTDIRVSTKIGIILEVVFHQNPWKFRTKSCPE